MYKHNKHIGHVQQFFLLFLPFFCLCLGTYYQMSEMSHIMLTLDMKYPLEKVQHCCHVIEAILERKETDENAHDFISKMVTERVSWERPVIVVVHWVRTESRGS